MPTEENSQTGFKMLPTGLIVAIIAACVKLITIACEYTSPQ